MTLIRRSTALVFTLTIALAIGVAASACGPRGAESPSGAPVELRVSAAVSLTESLRQVAAAFETRTGTRTALNLAGSNTLAAQIVEGAAVDVFISADAAQMDRVARAGALLDGTRADILSNRLVVIVPRDEDSGAGRSPSASAGAAGPSGTAAPGTAASGATPSSTAAVPANTAPAAAAPTTAAPAPPAPGGAGSLAGPRDLLRPELRRLALGDPAAVPAGVYARQYLERAGLWATLQAKVVPLPHVRAVVTAVSSGSADAGIVYQTDAAAFPQVRIAWIVPAGEAPDIVYPAAVLRTSRHPDEARAFVAFLRTPEAAALFTAAGFTPR